MKIHNILLLIIICANAHSQTPDKIKVTKEPVSIKTDTNETYYKKQMPAENYVVYDEGPEFPGGYVALNEFIKKNFQYPASAKDASISGNCFVKFTITSAGDVTDVELLKGITGCLDCDYEAIRLIKLMPKWKPAIVMGIPVNSSITLPVKFKIQ